MIALLFFSACSPSHKEEVDRLNSLSYAYHYRSLDSTKVFADSALSLSEGYSAGYAEACNNLAFVAIAKMDYARARKWLAEVERKSNNQIELLIADIQYMRICQREAHNKDFYSYREKAQARLKRIGEEADRLPPHDRRRAVYAHSEFDIVAATYFYYVGLDEPMGAALNDIRPDDLEQDTAQYLNYLYNIGSGGAISEGTPEQIAQTEFDYLIQCYMIASSGATYPFWQANALQALSEHLQRPVMRDFLVRNNLPAIQYLNVEQMPDSLLAGNLAQRALNFFLAYGDVYQIAGGYRTLAECYFAIKDYNSAGDCLIRALDCSPALKAAPDLVASIRERLCLVYSAIDDKPLSDYNRNLYLDLQEQTRQDRQLEARAALLDESSTQLNWMIAAVVAMIALVILLLYLFDRMRRRKDLENPVSRLLLPLEQWRQDKLQEQERLDDRREELQENLQMVQLHVKDNKKRNLEQRAKVSLVNSITPFIDRMIHEVDRLADSREREEVRKERYEYISELTDKINQYNQVLTQWIQMRQGTLSLRIESFPLQPLFDIVQKGKMGFLMKGISLEMKPTDAVVKADRTLTLFMINTIADNARKFTPEGGKVTVAALEQPDYVEISITDTGRGMDEGQLSHVFDRTYTGGHGFGLLNCKGIIEKYKKVSQIFAICDIQAQSEVGKGSRFSFRLPKGLRKMGMVVVLLGLSALGLKAQTTDTLGLQEQMETKLHHKHSRSSSVHESRALKLADDFADSAYFSNINGTYARTLQFADSAMLYLNRHYLLLHPGGKTLMVRKPRLADAAELKWYQDSLPTDYHVILDIRNESAVAALALHDWSLYNANNKVYTQLFREQSADSTLPAYVRTMQQSENSKTVAVILLLLLLLQLPVAYYFLYYRHVLSYKYAVEKVNGINRVLLDNQLTDEQKLLRIESSWKRYEGINSINCQLGEVVEQIKDALRTSIAKAHDEEKNYELAEDELHRVEYENGKLHVANSVLDNCLSTLKHETMYYPSRIRQLIDDNPNDVKSLRELVDYYKSLYTMLSAQAMEQVEEHIRFDRHLVGYLFELLRKASGAKVREMTTEWVSRGEHYDLCRVTLPQLLLTDEECRLLFTALTRNVNFLLCRQIVREFGEVTNLRGCGISASLLRCGTDGEGGQQAKGTLVEIVLPKGLQKYMNV